MLLAKQLRNINFNGVRNFSDAVHKISNPSRIRITGSNTSNCMSGVLQLQTSKCHFVNQIGKIIRIYCFFSHSIDNASILLASNTPSIVAIRNHYRNHQYHPSRIVRAYRKTRTWFTEHFVLAERPFENAYSFSFLLSTGILFIFVSYLNLQLGGGSGGLDVDKTQQNEKKKE